MRRSKRGLQQPPTDSALCSGIDGERSNPGYRAFRYDRDENAANDAPLRLDQKSLGVWIIDLALNKSRRNCEGGELRWKMCAAETAACARKATAAQASASTGRTSRSWGSALRIFMHCIASFRISAPLGRYPAVPSSGRNQGELMDNVTGGPGARAHASRVAQYLTAVTDVSGSLISPQPML